ncbi:hypothetical protein CR513_58046, partial [Mucuna pruriens]
MEENTPHYLKVATRPNGDPQYSIPVALGQLAQRPMVKSLQKEVWKSLEPEVQPAALSALTQYYDPPLRCFTFQGFQLAPTLEEYERLIGIPCDKSPPYLFKGHYPSLASVARLLKVPKSEVLKLKKNQNGVEGIPEVALKRGSNIFRKKTCWLSWTYLVAIDAFLSKRDRGEHPVVAVLANTYYTLDYCSKKNEKGLRCCTSLLILWLTVHLFHSSKRTRCLVEDHYWSCIKPLTKAEWTAHLDEAMEKSIRWYSQWNEREDVIIWCGGFPNISLMGTQGAINCNLELTLRQAGYSMVLPPFEEAVTPFIIHGLWIQEEEHLKKIRQAWKKVVRKGPE